MEPSFRENMDPAPQHTFDPTCKLEGCEEPPESRGSPSLDLQEQVQHSVTTLLQPGKFVCIMFIVCMIGHARTLHTWTYKEIARKRLVFH